MQEEWKDVVGYEGSYQVSNLGRVKSMARKHSINEDISTGYIAGTGYPSVMLHKKGHTKVTKYIHALVAELFIGARPEGCDVMHLDGTRTNNNVDNLRYGSRSCNFAFMVDDGTAMQGEKHAHAKLTDMKVKRIREFSSVGISNHQLAETFGVRRRTISDVVRGKTWSHVS